MPPIKLKDGLYSVGVLNPNLRVFDIIMRTDYGTTYNAFLIEGSEKKALVETVHTTYFDEYLENIKAICQPEEIDYIILNHTEPDHSGSLARLAEVAPNAVIVTSMSGSKFLPEIANRSLNIRVVGEGDKIDLGGRTLRFTMAPFLHWPDSMFTFLEEDNVAFTCDFFGCHYCEPRMLDRYVTYRGKYTDALEYYYSAIFGPFADYVRAGLAKFDGINPYMVCTSHGPVLTQYSFDEVREKYRLWSAPEVREQKIIEIFYVSAYGCTREAARCMEEGIKNVLPDAQVGLWDVIDHDMGELAARLNESDAFLIGTPTINKDALPPIMTLLSNVDAINLKGRPCAVFGSFGWSGEGVPNVVGRLQGLKAKVYENTLRFRFVPSDSEKEAAVRFAEEFAKTL